MPSVCAVVDCENSKFHKKNREKGLLSFHSFPKDKGLAKLWLLKCKRKDKGTSDMRICSSHFSPDDYERDLFHELLSLPIRKKLKPNSVPSIFPSREDIVSSIKKSSISKNYNTTSSARADRQKIRMRKQQVEEILKAHATQQNDNNIAVAASSNFNVESNLVEREAAQLKCEIDDEDHQQDQPLGQSAPVITERAEIQPQRFYVATCGHERLIGGLNAKVLELQDVISKQRTEIIRLHDVIQTIKSEKKNAIEDYKRKLEWMCPAPKRRKKILKKTNNVAESSSPAIKDAKNKD